MLWHLLSTTSNPKSTGWDKRHSRIEDEWRLHARTLRVRSRQVKKKAICKLNVLNIFQQLRILLLIVMWMRSTPSTVNATPSFYIEHVTTSTKNSYHAIVRDSQELEVRLSADTLIFDSMSICHKYGSVKKSSVPGTSGCKKRATK